MKNIATIFTCMISVLQMHCTVSFSSSHTFVRNASSSTSVPRPLSSPRIASSTHLRLHPDSSFLDHGATLSLAYTGSMVTNRYTVAFAVSALKGWAADVVAQKVENKVAVKSSLSEEQDILSVSSASEPKFEFKYMRNLAFLIYGGLYQGIFQEYLYNEEFNHLFGTGSDIQTALLKNGFNLLVIAPFLCLPMAYIIQALVMNKTVTSGIESYMEDVQQNGLVQKYWMLWGPVNMLTFSVVPEELRIPFITAISFFWSVCLASISGSENNNDDFSDETNWDY